MTQPPPSTPSDRDLPINPETARVVLHLNEAIRAFRAGKRTGIPALDLGEDRVQFARDDEFRIDLLRKGWKSRFRPQPDHIECSILTALADTYGSEILTNTSLGSVVRLFARHGGITLVQRVLWGESASDAQLATMLGATRAAFTHIAFTFSKDLLAEANDLLSVFRLPSPGEPNPKRVDRG